MRGLLFVAALALAPCAEALTLQGLDGRAVDVSAAQIKAMTHVRLDVVQHGKRKVFTGPLLADVLKIVNAPSGERLKGPDLADVVIVTARDGYAVTFALAETDPAMRKQKIILADTEAGKPIAVTDGPLRVVVEGDLRPARAARMVEKVEVRRVK